MSSTGQSCGTTGFMEIFDLVADVITRNNVRKGAIKVDLDVWHPDILEFIKCKDNTEKLNKMNISVMISNDFMKAVKNDEKWNLKFPDYENNKELYDKEWNGSIEDWEEKGYPVKVYDTIKAQKLYHEIMKHAYATGEPGVSFKGHMNEENPNPHLGRINATNPCSEFNSIPYNSCNLGSINLYNMIKDGKVDWEKLEKTTKIAIRYIDDMITVNELPLEKIEKVTKSTRPIGLGIMGLGTLLYALDIPYNSQEAKKKVNGIMHLIKQTAIETSKELAEEKGVYSSWEDSKWHKKGIKIRNCNHLSIAPNGSISFIAGCISGGLEPEFALVYKRRINEGKEYLVVNPELKKRLKEKGIYSEKLIQDIFNNNGSVQGMSNIPEDIKETFIIANEISPEEHLDILEVFYDYVDLSASKTINFSKDSTVKDVKDVYMDAWERGIKCVSIYRDGSRENQTLSTPNNNKEKDLSKTSADNNKCGQFEQKSIHPIDRPKRTEGSTETYRVGCGKLYITINRDKDGEIIETILNIGNDGVCQANVNGLSRMISLALRSGIDIDEVIDQLTSVPNCDTCRFAKGAGKQIDGRSCPDAVGKALEKEKSNKNKIEFESGNKIEDVKADQKITSVDNKNKCPECGAELNRASGCLQCSSCGWSKCS